mmetsp:Transcript_15118/g.37377  ORF Transcript_15118/g.37377 Transcript_15118/m.37377 type:complete len:247 (+) Transcript_15118:664-1404(+)
MVVLVDGGRLRAGPLRGDRRLRHERRRRAGGVQRRARLPAAARRVRRVLPHEQLGARHQGPVVAHVGARRAAERRRVRVAHVGQGGRVLARHDRGPEHVRQRRCARGQARRLRRVLRLQAVLRDAWPAAVRARLRQRRVRHRPAGRRPLHRQRAARQVRARRLPAGLRRLPAAARRRQAARRQDAQGALRPLLHRRAGLQPARRHHRRHHRRRRRPHGRRHRHHGWPRQHGWQRRQQRCHGRQRRR